MPTNEDTFSKNIVEYVSRVMYAAFEDIELDTGEVKFSEHVHQNYKNLVKDKSQQSDKLTPRFTVSVDARKYHLFLYKKLIEEVNNIVLASGDDVVKVIDKLKAENGESFAAFMFRLAIDTKPLLGATVSSVDTRAPQQASWFNGIINADLPNYASKQTLSGIITENYNLFLKAFAWRLAQLFNQMPDSNKPKNFTPLCIGLFAALGMPVELWTQLSGIKTPTPPRKPKGGKSKKKDAVSKAEIGVDEPTLTPVTAAVLDEVDKDLAAALASV